MTTQTRSFLAVSLAAFALACADATSPSRTLVSDGTSQTITQEVYLIIGGPGFPDGLLSGQVRLCKTANEGGTFSFTATTNGSQTIVAAPSLTVPSGGGTACVDVYTSTAGINTIEDVVITEGADPTADWDLTAIDTRQLLAKGPYDQGKYTAAHLADAEDLANRKVTLKINADMARIVTFTNTFTAPPVTGCTYTKGWYRNNGSSTVIAVDGRSVAEAQAIFNATPGKPGTVTFGGNNTLLNLYQQLLTALNNLGGDANEDAGPPAVDDAIDAAQDGTGGSGTDITTTLTQQEMSDLIATLSAFNEGTFQGWPHCDD
jgi:hypothetical protein